MTVDIRTAALLLMPAAALFSASVAPPTAEEVYGAIRSGETAKVQGWIASGWQVNATDERGNTPLIHASTVGNAAMVRVLIGAGADPKTANNFGVTPLIVGASDPAKAKMLVEAGADVNSVAGTGRTALIVAAAVPGNSGTVKMLLERGAGWKAVDKMGVNALLAAANAGNMDAVRMLVDRGADAAYSPSPGFSALHSAASNRDVSMVRYLLAHGAKPDALMNLGLPVRHGTIALERITPLMLASTYGPIEAVRALLQAGADVNAKDVRGMTPLMFAVSSEAQDAEVVKLLLASGARRQDRSNAGETALDWARKFNRRAVVALLGGAASDAIVAADASTKGGTPADSTQAIERAVNLLQRSQTEFFRQAGCLACHHGAASAMAARAARTHGVSTDEKATEEFRQVAAASARGIAPMTQQLVDPPGATDTIMYALAAMDEAGVEPSPATDGYALYLLRQYRPGTGWSMGGISRAPLEEGRLHRIATTVKVLGRYLPPALDTEYKAVVKQLGMQIRREPVRTTDDAAMKVLALRYTGATEAELGAAARNLESLQRADGGWGGNPNLAPDAYSTGLAIFALSAGRRDATPAPSYGRGAAWLLRNQEADGSWHVRSRAAKFQPYFESGFPHGADQWISSAGTAWAVAGLAAAR